MRNSMEKRKNPRISVSLPIRYKELHGKTYLTRGTLIKDLSKGGVRFHCDKFLSLACHLFLELRLPSILKPINMISKVVWIRKLRAGDNYEIGNQFLAMSSEDETALSDYLQEAVQS